jgi:hypothetical protein
MQIPADVLLELAIVVSLSYILYIPNFPHYNIDHISATQITVALNASEFL